MNTPSDCAYACEYIVFKWKRPHILGAGDVQNREKAPHIDESRLWLCFEPLACSLQPWARQASVQVDHNEMAAPSKQGHQGTEWIKIAYRAGKCINSDKYYIDVVLKDEDVDELEYKYRKKKCNTQTQQNQCSCD